MNKKTQTIIFLIIGAVGIIFSGVNWHNVIAAWIAPIFLLFCSRNIPWKRMWLFFIVLAFAGAISQTANNLMHIPALYVVNGICYGILTIIPYLVDKLLCKKNGKFYNTLIFPALIAVIEFIANFVIGTWGSVAHSQYYFKPLMQVSSLFGIYSIWFFVAWFASFLNWIYDNKLKKQLVNKGILIFGSVFFSVLIYGTIRTVAGTKNEQKVKIATVKSDQKVHKLMHIISGLDAEQKGRIPSSVFSDSPTIKGLINETKTAINNNAKIVVWNEIALVLNQQQKELLISEIQDICQLNNVYVLTAYLEACSEKNKKLFNNVGTLISSSGEIVWEYKKSYLEPSAEAKLVNAGDFDMPVVKTEYGNIGNVICADLDMQHYIKQAGEKEVDILLVPAFDWEEITPLHTRMAVVHAIQFGCNIVRSNGKGLSAMYDYKGKEISALNNLQSKEKILYGELPVKTAKTVYAATGDVLIVISAIFLLLMVFVRIKTVKKQH